MSDVLTNPPRTVMQVFKMLPEGTLAEIVDNALYMSPAPNPFHQRILISLATGLNTHLNKNQLGEIFVAPTDLYLDETANAVQPDILFISKDNPLSIDSDGLHGVADLIIEILSPGNKNHDTVTKKALYEKFGVKEYWVVDPKTRQAAGYGLRGNTYEFLGEFIGKIKSPLLKETFAY